MNTLSSGLPLPLALRSGSHGQAVRAAQGFGAVEAAAIEKVQARFVQLVDRLQAQGPTGPRAASTATPAPQLRAPDPQRLGRAFDAAGLQQERARLSPHAALLALVGTLGRMLGASSLANLVAASKLRAEVLAGRSAQGQQLAAALEAALAAERAAADVVDAASAEAQQALAAAEAARAEVDRLQQALDGLDPADPDYERLRAALEGELSSARQTATAAAEGAERAGARLVAASDAYADAVKASSQARAEIDTFDREDVVGLRPPQADMGSRSARMQALIGLLSQIMSDASLEKIRTDSEMAIARLEASQKEQMRLAEEQEAELERAREAEQKSGCFGKVFDWVGKALAVVGSIAAIAVGTLTANPLLVVAGTVGLLMTVDSIQAEFSGFSVMGKVTEAIARVVTEVLVAYGVDRTIAEQIGAVVAVIVVMVAIIAASIAAGNASGAATEAGRIVSLVKQAVEVVQVLAQLASVAASVATSVGSLIVAGIEVEVARLLQLLENLLFGDDVIRNLLQMAQDAAAQLSRTGLALMAQASDILAEEASASRAVLSHIRTSA
ncbi:type III secretion system translocon subunit SctE [Stenotrophomonas sp. NPDC077659]|uniref:type III secretion system translocon subunit SctE n=1 Tax=Stenotrophomonas sp. NPDC077659 TaxID=3390694 RepID=UPI003D076963